MIVPFCWISILLPGRYSSLVQRRKGKALFGYISIRTLLLRLLSNVTGMPFASQAANC